MATSSASGALGLLLAAALLCGDASAQSEPDRYRTLVVQAVREFGEQNYAEAGALFEAAHREYPNARTLRGLGIVAFQTRAYAESLGFLEAALSDTRKPLTDALRAEALDMIERARHFVARLSLRVEPSTAQVHLDGSLIPGDTPGAARLVRVDLGEHKLLFSAADYSSEERTVRVRGGEELALEVRLAHARPVSAASTEGQSPAPATSESSAGSATPSPLAGALGPEQAARSVETRPMPPRADRERPSRAPLYKNVWLWCGVGVGVVAAVTLGAVFARRGEERTTREADPVQTAHAPPDGILHTLGARP